MIAALAVLWADRGQPRPPKDSSQECCGPLRLASLDLLELCEAFGHQLQRRRSVEHLRERFQPRHFFPQCLGPSFGDLERLRDGLAALSIPDERDVVRDALLLCIQGRSLPLDLNRKIVVESL